MGQIKVNVNEFRSVAKKFVSASEHCTRVQEQLKTASDDLLNNWAGKSREAFNNEYKTLYKNMYNYKDVLQAIAQDLNDIAARFEEADGELKDRIARSENN